MEGHSSPVSGNGILLLAEIGGTLFSIWGNQRPEKDQLKTDLLYYTINEFAFQPLLPLY